MNRAAHALSTVALAGATCLLIPVSQDAALVAAGVLGGIVLSPDLDQSDTPYGWTHRHRGISHWPVVGTLERALWFAGPAVGAWLWTGRVLDWAALILLFAGLCAADGLHIILDSLK